MNEGKKCGLVRAVFFYRFLLAVIMTCLATVYSLAQVNAYAKVTGITGGNVLNLSNIDETYHTFNVGEEVIVMQMQDDVIGANVNDDANFGNLDLIGAAGLYEVRTIIAKTGTTLTLHAALDNSYHFVQNSSVQVISYRRMGHPDFTTTAAIVAKNWDGNTGGVIAVRVLGTLTLNHSINASNAGFRTGRGSGYNATADCNPVWRTNASDAGGLKGEGIYKSTDAQFAYGRGKILNGAGGGNRFDAGGGGGGNFSAGGDGGAGVGCQAQPVGGKGGIALNSYSTSDRAFMGGGAGAGFQPYGLYNVPGGGGIVLISAQRIVVGACGVNILANGGGGGVFSDATWGGAAGGSIVLRVQQFDYLPAQAACPLTVSANGGNGGNSQKNGGGGGGQGRVVYSGPVPANVTTTTNRGIGGCNDFPACTSRASTAPGVDGAGISSNVNNTPLPVKLLYFSGTFDKSTNTINLQWTTVTEHNNSRFTVERSTDGIHFSPVATLEGQGDSKEAHTYRWEDNKVYESRYYYRLRQTDLDGKQEYFNVIVVNTEEDIKPEVYVYPSPASSGEPVRVDVVGVPRGQYLLQVVGIDGREVLRKQLPVTSAFASLVLEMPGSGKGIYTLKLSSDKYTHATKIVVK